MQNRLERNQRESLRNEFAEHPLMLTCQWTVKQFVAKMPSLQLKPEEVFCDAADVIDLVMADPDHIGDLLHHLWDDRVNEYMELAADCSVADAQLGAACVCYMAMGALNCSSQWHYKYSIVKMMMSDVHARFDRWKDFEDDTLTLLEKYDDQLQVWVDEYLLSEEYLSDEIIDCIERSAKSAGKGGRGKAANTEKDFVPTRATFTKNTITDGHLGILCAELSKNGWIPKNENPNDFLKLFSGKATGATIMFQENGGVLKELIYQMINGGFISVPKGVGYLQIVKSHFVDANREHFTDLKDSKCKKRALPLIKHCIDLLEVEVNSE